MNFEKFETKISKTSEINFEKLGNQTSKNLKIKLRKTVTYNYTQHLFIELIISK